MLTVDDIQRIAHDSLGSQATVRARRLGLFQISVPAYFADGDGAGIYAEPLPDGRIALTDLGSTYMLLTYSGDVSTAQERVLERLAKGHGFSFDEDGALKAIVSDKELAAGVFGLVQVEAEAAAVVKSSVSRGERAAAFREGVRATLAEVFGASCQIGYTDPAIDPAGDYAIDALIEGRLRVAVSVVANDYDAELALGNKAKLNPSLSALDSSGAPHWLAVIKDRDALKKRTQHRLDDQYISAGAERERLVPRIVDLTR